ncbi:MAG: sigma-70 family RNA polymerase sigma factor [Acidobacteria bacterium]|nr:sigma-70 family RNA polymerase sigma factor [Acidobacteriota bacterium]
MARAVVGTTEDGVRHYLQELGAHPLLTGDDEVVLGIAMAEGRQAATRLAAVEEVGEEERATLQQAVLAGERARTRFIAANLRLVVSIAKRYQTSGLPLLDLIQEGNLGLMRAVDKFEHERGFKFSTYATWWIRQSISRGIADKGRTIRVPAHIGDAMLAMNRANGELSRLLGREPTIQELATATGLSPARIVDYREVTHEVVSLSAPLHEDGELSDLIADPDAETPFDIAAAGLEREALEAGMAVLTDRERRVLQLRYGLTGGAPRTLEDVGREFDLTRERIRQIEAKALTKLRHPCAPATLRQLVDVS